MKYLIKRFFACYIDSFVIMILANLMFIVFQLLNNVPFDQIEHPSSRLLFLLVCSTFVLYYFLSELLLNVTVGKRILGLKIVGLQKELNLIKTKQVALRIIVKLVPMEPISILLNSNRIMWHDKASKTKVVDSKQSKYGL